MAASMPPGLLPLEKRVTLSNESSVVELGATVEVLEEVIPLADLVQSDLWAARQNSAWDAFGQQTTMWYRFGMTSMADRTQVYVLELPSRQVQSAHLFVFDHGQQEYHAVLGEVAGESGAIAIGKITFSLVVAPEAQLDIYVRVDGVPVPQHALKLSSERAFMSDELRFSVEAGMLTGIMAVLCFLSAVAFQLLRVREFLWLSVYGGIITAHLFTDTGYGLLVFWSSSLWWHSVGGVLAVLPVCTLVWLVGRQLPSVIAMRFLLATWVISAATLALYFANVPFIRAGVLPLLVPLSCAVAVALHRYVGQSRSSSADRLFRVALAWLGTLSLLHLFLAQYKPALAMLLLSAAWVGHLTLVLVSCFAAHRFEGASRLRQRLRVIRETNKKEKLEHELLYQTMYDSLTGCPNRVAILHRLEKVITQAPEKNVYICLIHLDRFKEINNTLGHHNGDELLRRVARRLSGLATQQTGVLNLELQEGKRSPLAAIDGVVFGLLLHDVTREQMQNASEQVLRSLSYPFEFKKMTLDISAHIGIASYPDDGKKASELLQHAYVAVELAQQQDDAIVCYTHELDPYSARRLTLVGELKHALRTSELEMYYQPQLDVKQDLVIGMEALIRWFHPEHGFISPAEFIPVAEKTGVIKHLTAWVLEQAIQDAAGWYDRGILLRVSVNLSAKNLQESDLPTQIIELLRKYRLPPEAIALEITETAMMVDPARALKIITQMHDFGIRLSVDDFGTGYSSLAYLKQLPVAEIKIDRSFVGEMCRNTDDQVIVNTTLNMSHNLGLEVVAEGVEDEQTLLSLKRLGCDVAQGYFIAKPMTLGDVEQWLIKTSHNVIRIDDEQGSERAAG